MSDLRKALKDARMLLQRQQVKPGGEIYDRALAEIDAALAAPSDRDALRARVAELEAVDPAAIRRVAFREAYRILEEKLEALDRPDDAMPEAMKEIRLLGWNTREVLP